MLKIMDIQKAKCLSEAAEFLFHHPDYRPIAGGTDVLVKLRNSNTEQEGLLLDISGLSELKTISADTNMIRIGALVTHQQIVEDPVIRKNFEGLSYACSKVGALQIRNKGTIGGNIRNGSPAADSVPVLAALGARIRCVRWTKNDGICERILLLEDYLKENAEHRLPADELIVSVEVEPLQEGFCSYTKVGARSSLAIAICSCALVKRQTGYGVAYGSMSKSVMRLSTVEHYLNETSEVKKEELKQLLKEELHPITDARASAQYRETVALQILWGMLMQKQGKFLGE